MATQVNQQFEQAFASLAYAFLQDKAQKLLEYLVGFQLIKKNDDDTRAAGAFGFKFDDDWFYAPMFFLSGDLKGHEMLYAKTPDLVLPLEESWINFLLSRGCRTLGRGNSDSPARSGAVTPDFRPYYRSPLQQNTKASAVDLGNPDAQDWLVCSVVKSAGFNSEPFDLRPMLEMIFVDPTSGEYAENAKQFDFGVMVKEAGFLDALASACLQRPSFKAAVAKFYSGDQLIPLSGTKVAEAVTADELRSNGLSREVFNYYLRDLAARGVVSDESDVSRRVRSLLRQKGVDDPRLIRANMSVLLESPAPVAAVQAPAAPADGEAKMLDAGTEEPLAEKEAEAIMRDGFVIRDTRKVASEVIRPPQVITPQEGGMYEVLDGTGEWVDALVIPSPCVIGLGSASTASQVVCKKKTALVPAGSVFASGRKDGSMDMPTVDFGSAAVGSRYVAVSPDGARGTVAFTVRAKTDSLLHVAPSTCLQSYSGPACPGVVIGDDWFSGAEGMRYKVLAQGTVAKPHPTRGMLVVPRDWKLIAVEDWPSFCPGDLSLAATSLLKKASAYPVGITREGYGFALQRGGDVAERVVNEKQAVWALVSRHGLREDAARACVREAADSGFSAVLVKAAAAPGYMANVHELDQPAMYMDETGVPVNEPASQISPVDGMREDYATDETYRWRPVADPRAAQAAEQAAGAGDKEIFDLAALSSLVNAVEIESRGAKFLRDITRGLDRVGRLLFMYYWHYDKYAERYGDDEMQELEEALRNTFTSVGATVLFLKKRTIEPDRAIQGSDANLDDVADTE